MTLCGSTIDTAYDGNSELLSLLKNLYNPEYVPPKEIMLQTNHKNIIPCVMCLANLNTVLDVLSRVDTVGLTINKTDEY